MSKRAHIDLLPNQPNMFTLQLSIGLGEEKERRFRQRLATEYALEIEGTQLGEVGTVTLWTLCSRHDREQSLHKLAIGLRDWGYTITRSSDP